MSTRIVEEFLQNQSKISTYRDLIQELKDKNKALIEQLTPLKVDQAIELINSRNLGVTAVKANEMCLYISSQEKISKEKISEIFSLIPNYSFMFDLDNNGYLTGIYSKDIDSIEEMYKFINDNF